jgi:hypothetical protein
LAGEHICGRPPVQRGFESFVNKRFPPQPKHLKTTVAVGKTVIKRYLGSTAFVKRATAREDVTKFDRLAAKERFEESRETKKRVRTPVCGSFR